MKKVTLILAVALVLCIAVMPSLAAAAFPAASGSYEKTGVIGDASTTLTQTVAEDGSSIALTGAEGFININVATGYIGNWAGHRTNKYLAFQFENKSDSPIGFVFIVGLTASGGGAASETVVKNVMAYNSDMTENTDVDVSEVDGSGLGRGYKLSQITVPANFNGWLLIPNTSVDINGFPEVSENGALALVENSTWNNTIAADSTNEYHITTLTFAFTPAEGENVDVVLGSIVATAEDIPAYAEPAQDPDVDDSQEEGDISTIAYLAVAACSAGALVVSRKRR